MGLICASMQIKFICLCTNGANMQHDYGIPLIGHTMHVEGVVYFGAYVDPCVLLEFGT